jgi:hypothetical protein
MSNSTNHSSWIEKAPLLKPPFSYVSFAEFAKLSQVDTNANYSSTMDDYILTNSKTNPNKSHRGLAVTALNKFKVSDHNGSVLKNAYELCLFNYSKETMQHRRSVANTRIIGTRDTSLMKKKQRRK